MTPLVCVLLFLMRTRADRASYSARDLQLDRATVDVQKVDFVIDSKVVATLQTGDTPQVGMLQDVFLPVLKSVIHLGETCVCKTTDDFLLHFPMSPARTCEPGTCAGIVADMVESAEMRTSVCAGCPARLRLDNPPAPPGVTLGSPCDNPSTQESIDEEERIDDNLEEDITAEDLNQESPHFKPNFTEWGLKPIRLFKRNAAAYMDILEAFKIYRSEWGCNAPNGEMPEELKAKLQKYTGLLELLLHPKCYEFGLCYEGTGHVSEKSIIVGRGNKIKAGTPIVDYADCGCCQLGKKAGDQIEMRLITNMKDTKNIDAKWFIKNEFESFGNLKQKGKEHNQCPAKYTQGHIWQTCMSTPEFFHDVLKTKKIETWLSKQNMNMLEKIIAKNHKAQKFDRFISEKLLNKAWKRMAKLWSTMERTA